MLLCPDLFRVSLEHELAHGRLVDMGDASVLPTNPEDTFHNITATTKHVLDRGALPAADTEGAHAKRSPDTMWRLCPRCYTIRRESR